MVKKLTDVDLTSSLAGKKDYVLGTLTSSTLDDFGEDNDDDKAEKYKNVQKYNYERLWKYCCKNYPSIEIIREAATDARILKKTQTMTTGLKSKLAFDSGFVVYMAEVISSIYTKCKLSKKSTKERAEEASQFRVEVAADLTACTTSSIAARFEKLLTTNVTMQGLLVSYLQTRLLVQSTKARYAPAASGSGISDSATKHTTSIDSSQKVQLKPDIFRLAIEFKRENGCLKYNTRSFCSRGSRCKLKHLCAKCKEPHPLFKCPQISN